MVAHPDDVEFFCGGTVLQMTGRGVDVALVVATSGDKGSEDPDVTGPELARTREAEQRAAVGHLGASGVEFLRHPDAELEDTVDLRREIVGCIRRARPDVLLTFDPGPGYKQHPDHRVIGRVALDAAWPCARDRLTYPEQGPPWKTAEAWCFSTHAATLTVDVRDVLDRKIDARLEHRSQTGSAAALRSRWRRMAHTERFHTVDLR